jgi:alpha-ribazole phosphatase
MWHQSENQVTITLLRHGATKGNEKKRYVGKTDEPLSKEGRASLLAYKSKNLYPKAELLFVSPMKRCVETAKILYPKLPSVVIEEWKEIDFGAFEGKTYLELSTDKEYQAWLDSRGTLPFPKGEKREDFIRRCQKGFQKMQREIKKTGAKNVALVVHGGTIMALLSSYYKGDYFDYPAENGRGYIGTLKMAGKAELMNVRKLEMGVPYEIS